MRGLTCGVAGVGRVSLGHLLEAVQQVKGSLTGLRTAATYNVAQHGSWAQEQNLTVKDQQGWGVTDYK